MFCRKCGAELGENARFCKKCGTEVTIRPQSAIKTAADPDTKIEDTVRIQKPVSNESSVRTETSVKTEALVRAEDPVKTETAVQSEEERKTAAEISIGAKHSVEKSVKNKDASAKGHNSKLIVIVCICVLLAIGAAAAYVFIVIDPFTSGNGKKTEHIYYEEDDQDSEDDEDGSNQDEDESGNGEAIESGDETGEDTTAEENTAAIRQLSDIDEEAIDALFDLATNGLFNTAECYTDRLETKYDLSYDDDYRCVMSIEDAKDLMINTLGYEEVDSIPENDGYNWSYVERQSDGVHFIVPDCGEYNYSHEVTGIEMSEDGNLTVYGYQMEALYSEETSVYYRVYMVPNENSIWDGFTADSIEQMNIQHYYLPDVQERVYDIEELAFTEEEYRRARNEIFARHGRLFKSEDLQEYFNSQSWYYGMYEEIPESELNTFEKQNIAVLDKYKKMMKY